MMSEMKNVIKKLPHLGMRKWKSLLAVVIGFLIWQIVRLFVPELEIHPIYIYLYGIIEIRDSSDKTVRLGTSRIKATFTGLLVGLPFLFLCVFLQSLVSSVWAITAIELGILLIGILIVLCVAQLVGCKTFCGIAAIIFVILIVSHSDDEPLAYSLLRAVQTVMGVFIAWLINVKIFPYPGKDAKSEEQPKIQQ